MTYIDDVVRIHTDNITFTVDQVFEIQNLLTHYQYNAHYEDFVLCGEIIKMIIV